ncbi:Clavaminate synthase-like protein [Mycena floridula]|nr:Clavaminate synthase-like protein [Mycena floridula]
MASSESLEWLSQEYHDHNGSYIQILESPPTSLEFAKIVRISRPVVIKGLQIPASSKTWTDKYLAETMGDKPISIAQTPNGYADAVTEGPDRRKFFVEPYIQSMTMVELLKALREDSTDKSCYYLQSQNGNVYSSQFFTEGSDDTSEFEALRSDIPPEIPWCSEAFGGSPDAVNLWIGNGVSFTSIHSDPYENIYTVVRGAKHFTLLPPTDGCCLEERLYPHAVYAPESSSSSKLVVTPSTLPPVRWSSISDMDDLPPTAHPLNVTLLAGETLYLPVGWWHHVRQAPTTTIALNWWYDIDNQGLTWVLLNFLRPTSVADGNLEDEDMAYT